MSSSTTEVCTYLKSIGYDHLVTVFHNEGIQTMVALRALKQEDLVDMGCGKRVAKIILENAGSAVGSATTNNSGGGGLQLVALPLEAQLHVNNIQNQHQIEQERTRNQYEKEKMELRFQLELEKTKSFSALELEKTRNELRVISARMEEKEKAKSTSTDHSTPPPWWNAASPWMVGWNWHNIPSFPTESILLNSGFYMTIQHWLPFPRSWVLVYRSTRDGPASTTFHKRCNGIGPTVSIISSTSGYLFGGYNPNNWTYSNTGYQAGAGSFIFTLTNAYSSPPTRFCYKSHGPYDNNSYGPTFGGGHDICIPSNMNSTNGSSSSFPHSYDDCLGYGSSIFAGSSSFTVKDIEVFRLL